MSQRFITQEVDPAAYQALAAVEGYVRKSGLDPKLLHLIKVRASQINGCAFCMDMHSREARADGETEQRLYTLNGWRETSFFTPAERAALAYTEQVTLLAQGGLSQEVYDELARHFSQEEIVRVMMAVLAINCWNRLVLTSGIQPKLAA